MIRAEAEGCSLGLSVLNGQFHSNPQTLPVAGCLGNVITNFFWRQTQGTERGGQGVRGAPQVDDFDVIAVELEQHDGAAGVA